MLRHRSSITTRVRLVAGCLAGMLAIAACGSSESSDGERDRNVPIGPEFFFSKAVDGVARNRVGDAAIRIPISLTERRQRDGATLIAVTTLVLDGKGVRSEIAASRLTAPGDFDDTFGSGGVKTLSVPSVVGRVASISPDGKIVVVEEDVSGKLQLVALRRYDLASGQVDAGFGDNGRLDLSNPGLGEGAVLSSDSVFTDQDGGVILRGTAAFGDSPSKAFVTRWTPAGLDTNFGENGRLILTSATVDGLAIDESFTCGEPTLADAEAGILAVSGCLRSRNIVSDSGTTTGEFRRAIAFRYMTAAGVLSGDPVVAWIDPGDKTYEVGAYPDIVDTDILANPSSLLVTVEMSGNRHVLEFNLQKVDAFVPAGDTLDARFARLPSSVIGGGQHGVVQLGAPRLVGGESLKFVGVGVDTFAEATTIETGIYDLSNPSITGWLPGQQSLPIGDVPFASRTVESLDFVGDNIFMNIATNSLTFGPFAATEGRLNQRSGYLAIGRDGTTREPYGSPDSMARSPEQGGSPIEGGLRMPGLFPANDGAMFSVSHKASLGEVNSGTFTITKYSPDTKQKTVSEIVVDGFQPFFWHQPINAFDGIDNFYMGGFVNGRIGVAKLSLSKAGLDASYGDQGFAEFPRDGLGNTAWKWFGARLAVQTDGAVDAFVSSWQMPPNEFGNSPLNITTTRFTPQGVIDSTRPEMTVTIPELSRCDCPFDATSLSAAARAVTDAEGRLVVAIPNVLIFDDEGNEITPSAARDSATFAQITRLACRAQPCVGAGSFAAAQLRRYNRDGELDATFGTAGVSRLSLYEFGAEIFLLGGVTLAIGPDGNIVITAIGMEASFPEGAVDEWGITLDGEFSYSVLLNSAGQAINFVPREQPPAARALTDLVNDAQSQFGGGASSVSESLAGGQSSSATPMTAPPGVSADVVLPPAVSAVTQGDRPVVTITGTPADRALDVRWSVPEALAKSKASYTVTATPGGQKCTTATTSCVFKKLDPWTAYSFTIKTVAAASAAVPDSTPSLPVKPVRIIKRGSRTEPTKLITPASTGKQTWKATGGCKVTKDGKTFTTPKDAALCTLSLTTAKAGKVPKTTRTITVVVRAVAK